MAKFPVLNFEVSLTAWDLTGQVLTINYTAKLNGDEGVTSQIRACEVMAFDGSSGLIRAAEAFYGAKVEGEAEDSR